MAKAPDRKFAVTDGPAVREDSPLLIGLMGPSGGGKTFSALRLAKGIQSVVGGDIGVIDTEGRRALHYADRFDFRHIPFPAPYASLDYLAAMRQAKAAGCKVIVVDSMSHEHEGPGGMVDFHESELERMAGDDWNKRERMNMLAWAKPKAARRALINGMLQLDGVHFIFCFRAKESAKPVKVGGKTEVVQQGFVPIAGDEFVFEMVLNTLLLPNANGVPTWTSEFPGEQRMIKLPIQFRRALLESKEPLSEALGEKLAQWAIGGAPRPKEEPPKGEGQEKAQEPAEEPSGANPPAEEEKPADGQETQQSADPKAEPSTKAADKEPSSFLTAQAWQAGKDAAIEGQDREKAVASLPAGWHITEVEAFKAGFDEELRARVAGEEPAAGPEADEEPANGFATYAFALADAETWKAIREALQALIGSEDWKATDKAQQARARALADFRRRELGDAAGIDFLDDPHAFRCFIEGEAEGSAIMKALAAFKKRAAWVGLTVPAQASFEDAVKARVAHLAANASAEGAEEFQ